MRKVVFFFLILVGIVPASCTVDNGPGPYGGGNGNGGAGSNPNPTVDQCNPVTAAGCPSNGSTCDVDQAGYFACFPPPNAIGACGSCDSNGGPFCGPGLSCAPSSIGSVCYRYCCTDADCGGGGVCDTVFAAQFLAQSNSADQVGFCVQSLGDEDPNCVAPATPASGSCVGGYQGEATDGGGTDAGVREAGEGGGGEGGRSMADGGGGEGGR